MHIRTSVQQAILQFFLGWQPLLQYHYSCCKVIFCPLYLWITCSFVGRASCLYMHTHSRTTTVGVHLRRLSTIYVQTKNNLVVSFLFLLPNTWHALPLFVLNISACIFLHLRDSSVAAEQSPCTTSTMPSFSKMQFILHFSIYLCIFIKSNINSAFWNTQRLWDT